MGRYVEVKGPSSLETVYVMPRFLGSVLNFSLLPSPAAMNFPRLPQSQHHQSSPFIRSHATAPPPEHTNLYAAP